MESAPAGSGEDPFSVFRPKRARIVATVGGVLAILIFTIGAVIVPLANWNSPDRVLFASIGYAIATLFYRYATIRAVPTREGVTVRNLILTRYLEWPQIVGIQFGDGTPWVHLDLHDGDTLSVMAIQRADGPFAHRQASRLAALIQALGSAPDRDG